MRPHAKNPGKNYKMPGVRQVNKKREPDFKIFSYYSVSANNGR